MSELAKLVVKLEAQTAEYAAGLERANKQLSKFKSDADVTLGGIAKTFATVGLAAATALGAMVKSAIDNADHLKDLSKATGVSTESLSRLTFAAKQSGSDLDGVSTGIRKLSLAIAEAAGNAKSDAAVAFKSMGISVKDAAGNIKSADTVFLEIANRFKEYRDGANKNEIANKLFGKSFSDLIPLLDEGAAGINEMGDKAEKFGAVVSGDVANAADEFNDRLGEMKAQLVDGLGTSIATIVLPAFTELAKIWAEDAGRAEALHAIAGLIAGVLKGLVTVGIVVVGVFQQVGQAIYSINAAVFQLLKLDFKGALDELKGGFSNLVDNADHDMKKFEVLWGKSALNPEVMSKSMSKGHGAIKGGFNFEAPNLTAMLEAQKKAEEAAKAHAAALKKQAEAAEAARKKLSDMNDNLMEEVKTFGMGDAAATEYRLTVGSLADDVAKAGAKGKVLRDSIIEEAKALEALKNVDAIASIDQQIQQLTGHTVEAAAAAFDLSNKSLKASLVRGDNKEGLDKLETLRQLSVAQAQFNKLQSDADRIQQQLSIKEDQIQHNQQVGAINELEALSQLSKARKDAADQLEGIAGQFDTIAEKSGNPALAKNAEAFRGELTKLEQQTHLLGDRIKTVFEDALGGALADFISGTKSAGDAFKSFVTAIEGEIAQFIAKDLIRRMFGGLLDGSSGGGGGGGGWLGQAAGFVAGLFGGPKAMGGPVTAGTPYMVGERGPEMFVPSSNGSIVPNGNMGGTTNVFKFSISAPDGTISRRTEQQIASAAGRGISNSQRRNG